MNMIKKAFVVASAAVMCALPLAPAVANNTTLFSANSITASAAVTTYYQQYPEPTRNNGVYSSSYSYREVMWIQAAFNYLNNKYHIGMAALDVDGYYGQKTTAAVKAIQRGYFKKGGKVIYGSIKEDGLCGKDTRSKMKVLLNA